MEPTDERELEICARPRLAVPDHTGRRSLPGQHEPSRVGARAQQQRTHPLAYGDDRVALGQQSPKCVMASDGELA